MSIKLTVHVRNPQLLYFYIHGLVFSEYSAAVHTEKNEIATELDVTHTKLNYFVTQHIEFHSYPGLEVSHPYMRTDFDYRPSSQAGTVFILLKSTGRLWLIQRRSTAMFLRSIGC